MKKVLLLVFSCILFLNYTNAQEGRLGFDASFIIPLGDAGKVSDLGLGISAMYYFPLNDDENLIAGPSLGFDYIFGDNDYIFVPAAGSIMYILEDESKISVDLGYGLGLSPSGNDGGFHYKIGYSWGMARMSYSNYSLNGTNFGTIQFGAVALLD